MYKDDFDEAWEYFHSNKEWFPHVRKFHVKNRLKNNQVIIQDNVLSHNNNINVQVKLDIIQMLYHQKVTISYIRLLNKNKGSGEASKVLKEYFEHVHSNVFLTVRESNENANRFYSKVGMEIVGTITWSQGKMIGRNSMEIRTVNMKEKILL